MGKFATLYESKSFQIDEAGARRDLKKDSGSLDDKGMIEKHGEEATKHMKGAHESLSRAKEAAGKNREKIVAHMGSEKGQYHAAHEAHEHLMNSDPEYASNERERQVHSNAARDQVNMANRASFVHNHKHLD